MRPTILVVDDDPGIRDALHLIFDDDYEVLDAVDGAQALATLSSRKIDLVLLDLVMVGTDGFAVLEHRQEEHKKVPFIVLSGLNYAWTTATAMRLGAVDYVTKPFDEDSLRALVQATIASPTRAPIRPRRTREPLVLLVGVDLGAYASLAVLLRQQCRVERAATLNDAVSSPDPSSVSVLVIDLVSLGHQGTATLGQLRGHFSTAELIAIDADGRAFAGYQALQAPAAVTKLLAPIRRRLAAGDARREYGARVESILDHLATHYQEASVRGLARTIGTSPNHLSACFRDETGLPLKAYMTEIRLEAAKWLLIEAGEKIEVAALRVGFHDASHLSRLFVRHAGTRPGAFRNSVIGAS